MLWAFEPGEVMQRERELAVLDPAEVALDELAGLEAGRSTLALVGPCARTLATWGSSTNSSRTGAGSSALKRMSRSPIVSARRRRLPQTSARLTWGWPRISSRTGATSSERLVLQDPLAGRLHERDPLEDLGLGLGAEALELGDLARLGRGPQVGQALDLQRLVQDLDLLGPQARDPQQREDPRRRRLAQLVVGRQLAGRRKLDDLGVHRLADPGHLGQAAVGDHLREVRRQVQERLGRVVIGPAAERVLAPDLEERPHLVEDLGNRAVSMVEPL